MFEKEYKNTFNKIKPSNQALANALDAALTENNKHKNFTLRNALACGLAAVIVFVTLFTALRISRDSQTINGIRPAINKDDVAEFLEANKEFISKDVVNTQLHETQESSLGRDWKYEYVYHDTPTDNDKSNKHDYSETNNQVKGVQEADIVKTDGNYIYSLNATDKSLNISEANNGKTVLVSSVSVDINSPSDMLLIENTIVIIGYEKTKEVTTAAVYYDTTNKTNPAYLYKLTQDGYYVSSRAVESTVLLITNDFTEQLSDGPLHLPMVNGKEIATSDIWLPDTVCSCNYTILTAHNIGGDNDFDSVLSVLGASSIIYANHENIYLSSYTANFDKINDSDEYCTSKTDIYRIALTDNKLQVSGCGTVDGTLNNQFSFDEKDGILRVATNIEYFKRVFFNEHWVYERNAMNNKVFCLDKDLKVIGESEAIGVDERIKSVRYIGDIAYVVTFKQTDPLYAIDLSKPKKPNVLSELKITGFSTYMQQYSDNLLLGIGYEANAINGATTGLKLTLFDISDNKNISDISSVVYNWGNGYSSSEATYDHKALLINGKKGIIAIPIDSGGALVSDKNGIKSWKDEQAYVFFEFDGENLREKKKFVLNELLETEEMKNTAMRGIFIDDYAYVICDYGIVSICLNDYSVTNKMNFAK